VSGADLWNAMMDEPGYLLSIGIQSDDYLGDHCLLLLNMAGFSLSGIAGHTPTVTFYTNANIRNHAYQIYGNTGETVCSLYSSSGRYGPGAQGVDFAASPQLVSYQGRPVNGSGDRENGKFNMTKETP
jgi:hypothetical protein